MLPLLPLLLGWSCGGAALRHELAQTQAGAPYWGLRPEVLDAALASYRCAQRKDLGVPGQLAIIDFSMPSSERRLWVLDTHAGRLIHREHVAHGKYTGDDLATDFSNVVDSKQSSLGVFLTAETYVGKNGLSLRLDGLEPGFNDLARERDIVIHGADYVSEQHIAEYGRLGRSWGCPALPTGTFEAIIDRIQGGTLLVAYYPDPDWLASSAFLHCEP